MSAKFDNMAEIEDATLYTIAPGQNNFRPIENPLPRCAAGFELAARFHPNCWWPETPENRKDREDWNKLKGLAYFFGPNNRRSVIIAWRPGKLKNVVEVTAYTNDKRGGWKTTGQPVEVYVDQVFTASCTLKGREAWYAIGSYGRTTLYAHPWDAPHLKVFREVGTWIGGSGAATQAMSLEIKLKLI